MPTGTHNGYDPEQSLAEIRGARRARADIASIAPAIDRAVAQARNLWADPRDRESAGFGALSAAASIAVVATDGAQAMILNFVALFGQALVDDARAEMGREAKSR